MIFCQKGMGGMFKSALSRTCVSPDGRGEVWAPAEEPQRLPGTESCAQERGQQLKMKLVSSRMSGLPGQGHSMQVCTRGGR